MPLKAKLSSNSKINESQLGKIPGIKGSTGWIGLADWNSYKFCKEDFEHTGIGIRTKGFAFIDIDIEEQEQVDHILALCTEHLGMSAFRYRENSNRLGLLYKAEKDIKKSRITFNPEGNEAVEILGDGQQFVAYGVHPSGNEYKWNDFPNKDNLVAVSQNQITEFLIAVNEYSQQLGFDSVLKAKVDSSGNTTYESKGERHSIPPDHILLSMNHGEVTASEVFGNPDKFQYEYFAYPLDPSYRNGQINIAQAFLNQRESVINTLAHGGQYFVLEEKDVEVPIANNKPVLDIQMPYPPGLMGEMCKQANEMATFPYQTLSIITCVTMVAGIVGRKYNVDDQSCSLYSTVLMKTGRGKQFITNLITETLGVNLAGNLGRGIGDSFIGANDYTGPKSVVNDLVEGMSKVCVLTEAGLMRGQKSGNREGLDRVLLGMPTIKGTIGELNASKYSDNKNDIPRLYAPALSIIQESTPDSFIKSLVDKNAQKTGDLARQWIVRLSGKKPYSNKDKRQKFEKDITAKITSLLKECTPLQKNTIITDKDVIRYEKTPMMLEQEDKYIDLENHYDDVGDELKETMTSRAFVKTMRIAAVVSIFNGDKEITDEVYKWAVEEAVGKEIQNIDLLFSHENSSDVFGLIENTVMPVISKILNGKYADKHKTVAKVLSDKGIFTFSAFNQCLKNNKLIRDLDGKMDSFKASTGMIKVLNYMVEAGLIVELDSSQMSLIGSRSKKGYKVTEDFIVHMRLKG